MNHKILSCVFTLSILALAACTAEDRCDEIPAPAGTKMIVNDLRSAVNYSCFRIQDSTIILKNITSLATVDTSKLAFWSNRTPLSPALTYKARGMDVVVNVENDWITFCAPISAEPVYCANGTIEEDTNRLFIYNAWDSTQVAFQREFPVWQCLGLVQWNETVSKQMSEKFSAPIWPHLTSLQVTAQGVDTIPMYYEMKKGYYHDPGIPELPDSLYRNCGL